MTSFTIIHYQFRRGALLAEPFQVIPNKYNVYPKVQFGNFSNLSTSQKLYNATTQNNVVPEGIIAVAWIILGVSILLTGVVGTPVVLAAIKSSVLVDPLPEWGPVCEETDKGLERAELGVFMGCFTRSPSPAANCEPCAWTWAFRFAVLEAVDDPFSAKNIIACACKTPPKESLYMISSKWLVACACKRERERGPSQVRYYHRHTQCLHKRLSIEEEIRSPWHYSYNGKSSWNEWC